MIQLLSKKNIDMREYKDIGTGNQQRGTLLSRLKSRVSDAPAPRGCHKKERRDMYTMEELAKNVERQCTMIREYGQRLKNKRDEKKEMDKNVIK